MRDVIIPITLTVDQCVNLARVAEANGWGDLTLRQCIELHMDSAVDDLASA